MIEYSKEYLQRVAKAHRAANIEFRIISRKGKQYVSVSNKNTKYRNVTFWSCRDKLNDHFKHIFPGAYVTSGIWSGADFEVTFRINP